MKCLAVLFISLILTEAFALSIGTDEVRVCSTALEPIVEKAAGAYRVKITYAGDRICQRLEILKRGKVIYREFGIDNHYDLGDGFQHENYLRSLTGKGKQLIVRKWTGGMHCCYSLLVFNLNSEFRKLAEIDAGNSDPELVDLDGDGIAEIKLFDDFLAEQFSCYADSAFPDVVIKYSKGRFAVAPEFMKKPPPSLDEFDDKIPIWRKGLREHGRQWPPPDFMQDFTALIFHGNRKQAFELLEKTWPHDVVGKKEFKKEYREALNSSRYYRDFEKRL